MAAPLIGSLLQMVSVEIGEGCDLAPIHDRCPASLGASRYREPLTDRGEDWIPALYHALASEHGFTGWANFSYYNEPTLDLPRLLRLADAVSAVCLNPLMLITNGRHLPDDPGAFRAFRCVHITDYGGDLSPDPAKVAELVRRYGPGRKDPDPAGIFLNRGRLDSRIKALGADRSDRPCRLPFADLAFDHRGTAHLCCVDWRGAVSLGHLERDGLPAILDHWLAVVTQIAGTRMTPEAPRACRRCRFPRYQAIPALHRAAHQRAEVFVRQLCG